MSNSIHELWKEHYPKVTSISEFKPFVEPGDQEAYDGEYARNRAWKESEIAPRFSDIPALLSRARLEKDLFIPYLDLVPEDEYDILLGHTCSSIGRLSSEYEQTGFIGRTRPFFISEAAMARISARFTQRYKEIQALNPHLDIDIPRDTSLSYPIMNSCKGVLNRVGIWLLYSYATGVMNSAYSLEDLLAFWGRRYGPAFIALGYRLQHKGGELVFRTREGRLLASINFGQRVRAIYIGLKVVLILVRKAQKLATKTVLSFSGHDPHSDVTSAQMLHLKREGFRPIFWDFSKFDKNHGEEYSRQYIRLLAKAMDIPLSWAMAEFDLPVMFFKNFRPYLASSDRPLLSGSPWTSILGNLNVEGYIEEGIVQGIKVSNDIPCGRDWRDKQAPILGKKATSLIYIKNNGDDMLGWIKDDPVGNDEAVKFEKFMDRMECPIDKETLPVYLGMRYDDPAKPKARISRVLMGMFSPEYNIETAERKTISKVASLDLLGESVGKELHGIMSHHWNEEYFGPKFSWNGRHDAMLKAVEKETAKGTSTLRDLTLAMYSGLEIDALAAKNSSDAFAIMLTEKYTKAVASDDDSLMDDITGLYTLSSKNRAILDPVITPLLKYAMQQAEKGLTYAPLNVFKDLAKLHGGFDGPYY